MGRGAAQAVQFVGTFVLVLMVLHVVANALGRSWFDAPVDSTIGVVSYWYMPAVVFLGMVLAKVDGSHTEARIVFGRLSARLQREVHAVGQLLAAALCAGFAWYGFTEAVHNQEIGLTEATGLVIWPTTFLVPLCFAVLTVLFVVKAFAAPTGEGEHHDIA